MPANRRFAAALIAASWCGSNATYAAADHLTPCTDLLSDYYTRVATLMSQAANADALWTVTVFPSRGQAEWSVRAIRLDDGYALRVVQFDRSLWNASWSVTPDNKFKRDPSTAQAETRALTRKISPRLFTELEAQIRQALQTARPYENPWDNIVLDNPEVRFEAPGSMCAHTYHFDADTRIGKLVGVVLRLCKPPDERKLLRMLKNFEP